MSYFDNFRNTENDILKSTRGRLAGLLFGELFQLQREIREAGLGLSAESEVLTYERIRAFVEAIMKDCK